MMASCAVSVECLTKYFPPALSGWRSLLHPLARPTQRALDGVSFTLGSGEAMALVGTNGAGKSTLLRILATLILPTCGRARLAGFDVQSEPARARASLGYHTGDDGFYGRLTGRENLRFFASMSNRRGAEAAAGITRVAEWLGLSDALDRPARTLSTGMAHRLGLARALLHGPSVLLLDEPTRSLDPLAAAEFRRLLKNEVVRRRGTALLFASHSLSEVEEIADRVALLSEGKLIACDSPRGLCAAAGVGGLEQALARLMGRAPFAETHS